MYIELFVVLSSSCARQLEELAIFAKVQSILADLKFNNLLPKGVSLRYGDCLLCRAYSFARRNK